MKTVEVRVPATSANLGPGFDTLGLALDLWNQTSFSLTGDSIRVTVQGEGEGQFPSDETNLIPQSALRLYETVGAEPPTGLQIVSRNQIPPGSGLGSSAAAVLTGLLGANALLGGPLNQSQLLALGTEIEGHPDNLAPALLGGLTLTAVEDQQIITRQVQLPEWQVVVVLPEISLSTAEARLALPAQVALSDAVSNLGRTALVVEALRAGDLPLLNAVMRDRLHQPYRLPLLPGAPQAIDAAQKLGAGAALSGAGPSVIAFTPGDPTPASLMEAVQQKFSQSGIESRGFRLKTINFGAVVHPAA